MYLSDKINLGAVDFELVYFVYLGKVFSVLNLQYEYSLVTPLYFENIYIEYILSIRYQILIDSIPSIDCRINIYFYSLCILCGIILAYFVITKEAKRQGIRKDKIVDLMFYCIIFGIIGARIYYCIFKT